MMEGSAGRQEAQYFLSSGCEPLRKGLGIGGLLLPAVAAMHIASRCGERRAGRAGWRTGFPSASPARRQPEGSPPAGAFGQQVQGHRSVSVHGHGAASLHACHQLAGAQDPPVPRGACQERRACCCSGRCHMLPLPCLAWWCSVDMGEAIDLGNEIIWDDHDVSDRKLGAGAFLNHMSLLKVGGPVAVHQSFVGHLRSLQQHVRALVASPLPLPPSLGTHK